MEYKITMCTNYTTTGYPLFKPRCLKYLKAGLKCHKENKNCKEYKVNDNRIRTS